MALMKQAVIPEFFARLKKAIPEPETELEYDNVYHLLVAVVLSAQATDVGVNRATTPLFKIIKTPAEMVALGEKKLIGYIKTIGLFRMKAKNVIALSKLLIERHGGEVPHTHEELQALPGVGRKTANVVMNVAFGEATIAVDTHIFRVGNRTGPGPGQEPARGRAEALEARARGIPAARAPLADPARPLHLQGAHAGMPEVRGERPLPVQGEDDGLTESAAAARATWASMCARAASDTHSRASICASSGRPSRRRSRTLLATISTSRAA